MLLVIAAVVKHLILIDQFGKMEILFTISYSCINIGQIEILGLVIF